MNVAKHLYGQRLRLKWISHNNCNKRTVLSDRNTLCVCVNHYYCRRPMHPPSYPIVAQSAAKLYPIRVYPITRQNNPYNDPTLLMSIYYNPLQKFCYRHHFAASTPVAKMVNRPIRWKEKNGRKSKAAHYRPKHRRRRPINKKFPENMVRIEFMHSIEDINLYQNRYNLIRKKAKRTRVDDFDETPGIFRIEWNQSSVLQLAYDYYLVDNVDQLEYYNFETNDWTVIPVDIQKDAEIVKLYKGKGNCTMPLRLKSDFVDRDVRDDDTKMKKVTNEETVERSEAQAVQIAIRRAMRALRRERYVRISDTTLGRRCHPQKTVNDKISLSIMNSEERENSTLDNIRNNSESKKQEYSDIDDMTIISTKQWIIEQTGKDDFLASLLMSRPGTLKHLVQCLHWDRVWK